MEDLRLQIDDPKDAYELSRWVNAMVYAHGTLSERGKEIARAVYASANRKPPKEVQEVLQNG